MLKFLLILFVAFYLFIKIGGFIIRVLFGSLSQDNRARNYQQQAPNQQQKRRGDLNIDYVPEKDSKSSKDFKGGEYVDYEEL